MDYLSKKARSIIPYIPGEQPRERKYIKINTNENPYPISPAAVRAAQRALEDSPLYPDPEASELKRVIARFSQSQRPYGDIYACFRAGEAGGI